MDVHVPEAGHQVPAFDIDHLCVASAACLSAWQDGADTAILNQHGSIRPDLGLDAVDQVRMRKNCLHHGPFRLKSAVWVLQERFLLDERVEFTSAPWRGRW